MRFDALVRSESTNKLKLVSSLFLTISNHSSYFLSSSLISKSTNRLPLLDASLRG